MFDSTIKVSVVMAAFRRSKLLDIGLSSIAKYKVFFPLELIVVNDGIEDDTEAVCESYKGRIDIKYVFSGHRNRGGIRFQSPGFPINIGIKQSSGDIIVLTCPEIYHLDDCLNKIVEPLFENPKYMVVPEFMYFDDVGAYTNDIINNWKGDLRACNMRNDSIVMPFLMGLYKDEIVKIGGYDEDFTGYASEDNDLIERLKLNGCSHFKVNTNIVHLHHGVRSDSGFHWEEPRWAHNRKLYEERKGQIVRNAGRCWGEIKLRNNIIEKNIEIPDWIRINTSGSNSVAGMGSSFFEISKDINKNVETKSFLDSRKQFSNAMPESNSLYITGNPGDYMQSLKNISADTVIVTGIPQGFDRQKSINFINELKKDFKKILLILPAGDENNKKDKSADKETSVSKTAQGCCLYTEDILQLNFDEVIHSSGPGSNQKQIYPSIKGGSFYFCTWNKYKLSRIPKKLHLYWDRTSRMSKLQTFTIDSFHRLNPDWPIYIYRPIQDYIGSDSYIPDYAGEDSFHIVENKEYVNIINIDIRDYGISLDLHNILRSDILRYHLLYNYGGVWSDFDVIWLRPMDYFHNIEYIGNATPDEIGSVVSMRYTTTSEHNISVMMSSVKNEFIKSLVDKTNEIQNSSQVRRHQMFGTEMLDRLYPNLSDVTTKFPDVVGLNYETFFPYSILNMTALYDRNDLHYINNNVMCIHWFNGNVLSKKFVNEDGYKKDCSMTSVLKKEGYI
jgi:GT2 family glycosyltransferase